MAVTYIPFQTGAGSTVNEPQWQKMARYWARDGVVEGNLNDLQVYADSSGMQVKVKTGAAYIQGFYYDSDAEQTVAVTASDPTNPRIDRLVLRITFNPTDTIAAVVLAGTAAASPVAPALTQSSAVWEMSLAQILVSAGVGVIAAGKITDERTNPAVSGYTWSPGALSVLSTTQPTAFPFGASIYETDTLKLKLNVGTAATPSWSEIAQLTLANTWALGQTITSGNLLLSAGTLTVTSANASAFKVGRLGATTPAFHVDAATATSITGLKVTSAASGGGVSFAAVGETNVAVTIDAAGSGTITINGTGTGAITLGRATTITTGNVLLSAGTLTVTSANAAALSVGRLGATTPALLVDASTATSITGISIKSAASGGGVAFAAVGETNVALTINAAGSGTISLNATGTGAITLGRATTITTGLFTVTDTGITVTSGALTLTSGNALLSAGTLTVTTASATAFSVGRLGATTPAFVIDAATGTSITGVKITAGASGGGVAFAAVGETNVALTINAAGSGTIIFAGTSTGAITLTRTTTLTVGGTVSASGVTFTAATANALGVGVAVPTDSYISLGTAGVTAGTSQYGVKATPTLSSGATTLQAGMYVLTTGGTGTYATTSFVGLYVDNAVKGASQTVTTAIGAYIAAQTVVATNSYGVYIGAPTNGSSVNLGLYNAGQSLLVGVALIGSGAAATLAQTTLYVAPGAVGNTGGNNTWGIGVNGAGGSATIDVNQNFLGNYIQPITTVTINASRTLTRLTCLYLDVSGTVTVTGTLTNHNTVYMATPSATGSTVRVMDSASGAFLTTGGTWTNNPSWRRFKTDIKDVAHKTIMEWRNFLATDYQAVYYRDKERRDEDGTLLSYHMANEHPHVFFILDQKGTPDSLIEAIASDESGSINTKDMDGVMMTLLAEHEREIRDLKRQLAGVK